MWRCRTIFNCTEACPREIRITKAIGEVKKAILKGSRDIPSAKPTSYTGEGSPRNRECETPRLQRAAGFLFPAACVVRRRQ